MVMAEPPSGSADRRHRPLASSATQPSTWLEKAKSRTRTARTLPFSASTNAAAPPTAWRFDYSERVRQFSETPDGGPSTTGPQVLAEFIKRLNCARLARGANRKNQVCA